MWPDAPPSVFSVALTTRSVEPHWKLRLGRGQKQWKGKCGGKRVLLGLTVKMNTLGFFHSHPWILMVAISKNNLNRLSY
ncbi:MAG: hypothetical protein R3C56_29075 [Pirellulaceae bacterium]